MPEPARLFIESSTPRASLALLRGSELVFEESFMGDRSHNALLFDPLQKAIALLETGETLATVVIGTGPGSYSGTRVGIAAGQGVALVHGCPATGLSSLLAVPPARGRALAIGDARRGSAWRVRIEGGSLLGEPELCPNALLETEIEAVLAQGIAVFSLEPVDRLGLPEELVARITVEHPDARQLATAWANLPAEEESRISALPPQPVYLRPPHITEAKAGHPLLRK
ncbi:tRNA (adenosine(37)-N6)-threonylcarbamoyltransferase complex dimerization subunit type 1 TsaB [Luteolibacter sp. GHJ8]|uniref:tRNA (Adenosine(37)-N6)-threonylcarbamoyltransferase complex dimerization subunit type 1 TsaB n=1 Tax=Luteolibacter rhizosphaerae TaxID=2989719 RepID=A0ABT3G580_9BACT|nr:tRNA (adenosine(37)-N6)-threonylcarbamoyltransferase complex dimerization subunit type 1 TsaB [Luteolibacter rhizosphaerae]MCW1914724.1 tRNA (adenosine(37)-N6)-threonylcarbamoyltransferase complex dimerization subunit type 1 TsaB [Luteolibacter rhizosphaerae]